MGLNAYVLPVGTLIAGVLLSGCPAFAAGPPMTGSMRSGGGFAPSSHISSAPMSHASTSGHISWHAGWNTGIQGAAWNTGAVRGSGLGWNNGRRGFGYGGSRRAVIVPFYPAFPLFDSGNYGYYDDAGTAAPPPDAGPDYMASEGGPYPPSYDPSLPPPDYREQSAPAQREPVVSQPPITVVLLTGQQFVVQNYAVMDSMLWDFSKPVARKIPLSTINLNASASATNAAGGEFPELTAPSTDSR